MAKHISFEQTEEEYKALSQLWSERGEHLKSLLYARKAYECAESAESYITLADALYESGNFEYARDIFQELLVRKYDTKEVYCGLIRCATVMLDDFTAIVTTSQAQEDGIIKSKRRSRKYELDDDTESLIEDIVNGYPRNSFSIDCGKIIYNLRQLHEGNIELLCKASDDNRKNSDSELAMAFSIFVWTKMEAESAPNLLLTCENALVEIPDNISALAAKVHILVSLGRKSEAVAVGEMIKSLEITDDIVELIKCAYAFYALEDDEGMLEYLEEIIFHCPELNVMMLTAIANMNCKQYARAKELFTFILRINPKNLLAQRWIKELNAGFFPKRMGYTRLEQLRYCFNAAVQDDFVERENLSGHDVVMDEQIDFDAIEILDSIFRAKRKNKSKLRNRSSYFDDEEMQLISCRCPIPEKCQKLCGMLLRNPKRMYCCFNVVPKYIKVKRIPTNVSSVFKQAYYKAYAVLSLISYEEVDERLFDVLEVAQAHVDSAKLNSYKRIDELAAAMAVCVETLDVNGVDGVSECFESISKAAVKKMVAYLQERSKG